MSACEALKHSVPCMILVCIEVMSWWRSEVAQKGTRDEGSITERLA